MAKRTRAKRVGATGFQKVPAKAVGAPTTVLDQKEGSAEEALLQALRQKADAYGIAQLAAKAQLSRESLYRTLSVKGNPRLSTLVALLDVLGLQLKLEHRTIANEEIPQTMPTLQKETFQLPSASLTPRAPTKGNVLKVMVRLMVERNSKFVRGKKGAREDIEYYVLSHYDMKKRWPDGNEYELTIPYDTDQELEDIIYRDIIQAASFQADLRNCFVEISVQALDGSERWWD